MRRLLLVLVVCCVAAIVASPAWATDAAQSGTDADGLNYIKLRSGSVALPYSYWCWTKIPASPETGTNLSRFTTTHDMRIPDTAAGTYVPVARCDVFHTNAAGPDSLTLYVYNKAVLDSLLWISSTLDLMTFPIYADSILFKAGCKSAATDWIVTTYFER